MDNKFIYLDISLKGLTLEQATRLKEEAETTIRCLAAGMSINDSQGHPVTVIVRLDERAFGTLPGRQAQASSFGRGVYQIEIGVGLVAQLWLVSTAITADQTKLRGSRNIQLLAPAIETGVRQQALRDFVFHFMVSFIFYHEFAHVVLGHLDWLQHNIRLKALEEFGQQVHSDTALQRRTLEGDADKQASILTAATIDLALKNNPYLRYPNLSDAFYDIGFIYGALFCMLDSLDANIPEQKRLHPDAHTRLGVALSFVGEYLNKFHTDSAMALQQDVYDGGLGALSSILHENVRRLDLPKIFRYMATNGERITALTVHKFKHRVAVGNVKSFEFC